MYLGLSLILYCICLIILLLNLLRFDFLGMYSLISLFVFSINLFPFGQFLRYAKSYGSFHKGQDSSFAVFPDDRSIFQSPKRRLRPKTGGLCSIPTRFLSYRVRFLRISAISSSVRKRILPFLVTVLFKLMDHDRFVFTDCLCNHFLSTTLLIHGRNCAPLLSS